MLRSPRAGHGFMCCCPRPRRRGRSPRGFAARSRAMRTELGVQLRAAIAAPVAGLAGVAAARTEVDRVLDSAERHPISIGQVTSLAEARTTVLLDEIVTLVGSEPATSRSADRRPACARSGAGRDPARLPGQLRRHRRRRAVAASASQHGSLPGAADREVVVDLAVRSRGAAVVFAGFTGFRGTVERP